MVASGPESTAEQSTTRTPARGPPILRLLLALPRRGAEDALRHEARLVARPLAVDRRPRGGGPRVLRRRPRAARGGRGPRGRGGRDERPGEARGGARGELLAPRRECARSARERRQLAGEVGLGRGQQ